MSNILELNELVEKVDQMKKENALDLSSDQDLSIAIMNLISIEEHFFFTGAKTGNDKYYDLLNEVRETRKQLLKKIIKTLTANTINTPWKKYRIKYFLKSICTFSFFVFSISVLDIFLNCKKIMYGIPTKQNKVQKLNPTD